MGISERSLSLVDGLTYWRHAIHVMHPRIPWVGRSSHGEDWKGFAPVDGWVADDTIKGESSAVDPMRRLADGAPGASVHSGL